jgi:hypothetical protein
MATLLDALSGSTWKRDLMTGRESLDEALAVASGFDDPARALRARAHTAFGGASLNAAATRDVAVLEARRRAQAESVMSRPGLTLVIKTDSLHHDFNLCGLDPQNLLQVAPGLQLHTRWVHLCSGQALDADLYVPTVHNDSTGGVRTVLSPADSVAVLAEGAPVPLSTLTRPTTVHMLSIRAPHAKVASSAAVVTMRGDTLVVTPLTAAVSR